MVVSSGLTALGMVRDWALLPTGRDWDRSRMGTGGSQYMSLPHVCHDRTGGTGGVN